MRIAQTFCAKFRGACREFFRLFFSDFYRIFTEFFMISGDEKLQIPIINRLKVGQIAKLIADLAKTFRIGGEISICNIICKLFSPT